MSTHIELLEAGKRLIAAEKALEDAKRDLTQIIDHYGPEDAPFQDGPDPSLPHFIWDNGTLYRITFERDGTPIFRQLPADLVAIAPITPIAPHGGDHGT